MQADPASYPQYHKGQKHTHKVVKVKDHNIKTKQRLRLGTIHNKPGGFQIGFECG